jgi:hypothetical protein
MTPAKVKAEKHYCFKPGFIIFESVATFVLGGVSIWIGIVALQLLISWPMTVLLIFTVAGALLYLQIKTFLVLMQYYGTDKGKRIVISADRSQLSLSKGSFNLTISNDDVINVEIYEGKPWGRFPDFDYIILYTVNNQEVIITQFTVPLLVYDKILEKFLRKKPRTYFKKRFNFIDLK